MNPNRSDGCAEGICGPTITAQGTRNSRKETVLGIGKQPRGTQGIASAISNCEQKENLSPVIRILGLSLPYLMRTTLLALLGPIGLDIIQSKESETMPPLVKAAMVRLSLYDSTTADLPPHHWSVARRSQIKVASLCIIVTQ